MSKTPFLICNFSPLQLGMTLTSLSGITTAGPDFAIVHKVLVNILPPQQRNRHFCAYLLNPSKRHPYRSPHGSCWKTPIFAGLLWAKRKLKTPHPHIPGEIGRDIRQLNRFVQYCEFRRWIGHFCLLNKQTGHAALQPTAQPIWQVGRSRKSVPR